MGSASEEYIVFLGTKGGPAIREGSAMPSSSLVVMGGECIVVDCGLGVTRALTDQGVELKNLETVFITHLHSDHYLELGPMLHTAWTSGLKTPVTVWGPPGLQDYWANFLACMEEDTAIRTDDEGRPDLTGLVTIRQVEEGKVADIGTIAVEAMRVDHPPLADCFALSFASPRARVVFSADTAYFPPLAEFAKGADLLVHEAILEEGLEALVARVGNGDERLKRHILRAHTPASDAARIADAAGVGALALSHLIPADDPGFTEAHWEAEARRHWSGPLHIGRDGMRIGLPARKGP